MNRNDPSLRAPAYGHFESAAHSFILTADPPAKWMNVHHNRPSDDEMYAEISPLGDGPVWVRDSAGVTVRLCSYDCRALYLRDEADGTVFCPWGAPVPTPVTNRSCEYHAAHTTIRSECHGLRVTQRVFVPLDEPIEITTVEIENLTERARTVSVHAFLIFDLGGQDRDGAGFGKDNFSEILPETGGVMVVNRNRFCPNDRCKGYLVTTNGFQGADGYRDHFLHLDFSLAAPRLLDPAHRPGNRPGYGPDCAAAIESRLTLPPGGAARTDFLLGQCSGPDDIRAARDRVHSAGIDTLFTHRLQHENERAETYSVRTGNDGGDALINHFVKKQISSYNINKSGFRDNLQNDVSLAMFDYPAARSNLLRALASQFPNGECPHGFRPLIRLKYADKPAWIFLTIPALIRESGDWSLLNETVPYLDSQESGSVLDHMLRAMRYMAEDTGRHGLCRQHHADWNDGLEATSEAGERESVMVTQQLCFGMLEMAALADRLNEEAIAAEARQIHAHFKQVINEVAWDGSWYVRTICEDGYHIGSSANPEGKIFMNPQSWAIWGRIADPGRARLCMESVDRHIETDIGFRICHPGFSEYDPRVGRMSNSMPGHVENGGCYNHAAGFKGIADCLLGRADKAWETFLKIAPDNPANPVGRSGASPISFNNFYSQVPQIYGQSGYSWRTGTANWFNVLLVEHILGARRHYDGLLIDPCLPASIPRATVKRLFRGATYEITIDNTSGRGRVGESGTLRVDGSPAGSWILPQDGPGPHTVDVTL